MSFIIPVPDDIDWGQNVTDFLVAIPSGCLQKVGGAFTLTADANFGASFGLLSAYFKTRASNPATAGLVRLANADLIEWRNFANGGNNTLGVNSSDQLVYNGSPLEFNALSNAHIFVGNVSNVAADVAVTGDIGLTNAGVTAIQSGVIVNAQINAGAAIAYTKLNLSGSIVNSDIYSSAAIAYSKLNLSASIVNADVNASAAIGYSKLALTGSILNADINASAAIAYSKLSLSGSIVNADINASAAIAYSKLALSGSLVNADINASAAIAYSKLALSGSIVNADVNGSAAIAYSKLNLANSVSLTGDITGTLAVSHGGTGAASLTAYAVLCGGTTSTGAVQSIAGVGASGQVLTSNGAAALPTFQNVAGTGTVNSGSQYQLAYYAANGTAVSGNSNIVTNASAGLVVNKNLYIGDGSSLASSNLLEIVNDNNTTPEMIKYETYGTTASIGNQNDIHYIRAGGTKASPTATRSGDLLSSTGWRGYDGTVVTNSTLAFQCYALEDFSPTAIGAKFHFEATPLGSVARNAVLDIDAGGLTLLAGCTIKMGASKISGLANGTVSTDAAAFGQIYYGFQAPVQAVNSTAFTTTSSSFQTTNCSASITPTSSSHRIKITVTGTSTVGTVAHSCFTTIARGTTDLSSSGLGFTQNFRTVSAGAQNCPTSITFIDSPATTSATTYNVRIKNDDNATTVGFGNTVDTVMILEEIV